MMCSSNDKKSILSNHKSNCLLCVNDLVVILGTSICSKKDVYLAHAFIRSKIIIHAMKLKRSKQDNIYKIPFATTPVKNISSIIIILQYYYNPAIFEYWQCNCNTALIS